MAEVNEVLQKISDATKAVDKTTKKELVEIAKESITNEQAVTLHLPATELDFDNAVVVEYTGETKFGIAVPYKTNGSILEGSVVTLIFDENKQFASYQELNVEKSHTPELVNFQYFVDNKNVKTGTFDIQEAEAEFTAQKKSWLSCMNTCLANQGLSNWAIGLFAALCAAACGTIILCAACIEGPLLVYSVQITNCLNSCGANKR